MVRWLAGLVLVAALAVAPWGCGAGGSERRVLVPAALPADVPLPGGAALRSTRDLGAKGLTLVFETNDPVAAVSAQLRSRLEAAGWSLVSAVTVEGSAFSSYRLRSRSIALGISTKAGGMTVVGLCYRGPELDREGDTG